MNLEAQGSHVFIIEKRAVANIYLHVRHRGDLLNCQCRIQSFSSLIRQFLHPLVSTAEDIQFRTFFKTSSVPWSSSTSSLFLLKKKTQYLLFEGTEKSVTALRLLVYLYSLCLWACLAHISGETLPLQQFL
jgi:hypothetical protein